MGRGRSRKTRRVGREEIRRRGGHGNENENGDTGRKRDRGRERETRGRDIGGKGSKQAEEEGQSKDGDIRREIMG